MQKRHPKINKHNGNFMVTTRIQSIDRALSVLEIVSESSHSLHPTEIAGQLQLPLATTHNIIRSLYFRGYLSQDKTRKYVLGHKCFQLQIPLTEHFAHLKSITHKYVEELADKTGDTTAVGCEYNMDLHYVTYSLGAGEIIIQPRKDDANEQSMHISATGKVIIACNGIDYFKELLKMKKIKKYTDATIVDAGKMQQQIDFFKEKGFMLCYKERVNEIAAIAVAIYDKDNSFVGAIGQNFPAFFIDSKIVIPEERAELLKKYADKIKDEL